MPFRAFPEAETVARAPLAAVFLLAALGCRERAPSPTADIAPGQATATLRGPSRTSESTAAPELEEGAPRRDPLERSSPPDQPSQRIAISGDRLAWLDRDVLHVLSLPELTELTQFPSPDARNVVALTGGGFLIAARDHVQRLSARERRPELFPHAPRLGPTSIIPSRQESEQFWLYYAGIPLLPRFDLGAPPRVASLPLMDWTELFGFDRRALLGLGDGSFVYTTADGLRRIDVEGRRENLPSAELAGRVWALARDARLDRVWAASEQHLYLVHVREHVEVLRRMELPPHPVAIGSDDGAVAVISIERWIERDLGLRVDWFAPDSSTAVVFRLATRAPERADGEGPARLEPELSLSTALGCVAVGAFGLQVYDYRRSVRLYPPDDLAQKLAPGAP